MIEINRGVERNDDKVRQDRLTGHVLFRWFIIRYLNLKNIYIFDNSPIVMVKSSFDLINGVAVVSGKKEKKERKEN